MPIKNGKNTLLNQNTGTLPDVSGAMRNWFQTMTFTTIVKDVVNFEVTEIKTDITFQGVIQPFSKQDLQMKPEGQRAWRWYTLHTETQLELDPDEEVEYLGLTYRVKGKGIYNPYGYYEYELVEDYQE
jgi:hypothetical protein